MSLDLLFPNFETLIRTPEDVARLNEAILQLAVQGKLVPQDPADEPASELLKRIREQRRRLVEAGKAVDTKPLPPISAKQVHQEIAKNWKWVRLAEIAEVIMGQSPPGDSYNSDGEGVPLINGPVEFSSGPFGETQKTKFTTTPTKMCQSGDLLVCVRGSTTGRTNIAAFDACIGRGVAAIRAYVSQEYLNNFILSQRQIIYDLGTGSTFPSVSQDRIRELLVPLPPLAEQRRIVAKVESLFAQTRALEAKLRQAQVDIVTVNRAALNRLSVAADDDAFASAWATVRDAFDLLYDDPRNVAELRQAILQLAVQGKLVPQDPADEQASELLKRIRAEKRRLVKEGKLREEKSTVLPSASEVLFVLPKAWQWVRLGQIADHRLGKMLDQHKNKGVLRPYVRNLNVQWKRVDLSDIQEMRFEEAELDEYQLIKGDLLMCEGGEPGRCAIWDFSDRQMMFQKAIHRVRPLGGIVSEYLLYHLWADANSKRLDAFFTGATIKHFTGKALANYVCAIPPLAEQRRIVAKVDQLMRQCDALAAGLVRAEGQRRALTAAALHGAFG